MFTPPKKILTRYASVLVDFALGGGKGIKEKEIVYIQFDSPALPLALEVYKRVLKNSAYPMVRMYEEDFSPIFFKLAKDHQLEFFPKKYSKTLVDTFDHRIYIMAERDPFLLKNVSPKKIMKANKSKKLLRKWYDAKEDAGKLTWTLALYATSGMAKEAGMKMQEYWDQILKACFLKDNNPIRQWQQVVTSMKSIRKKLNSMNIDKINVKSKNTDLYITPGTKRKWIDGICRNIPSFEIFTSPNWRGTEGKIHFDLPLYRYGNIIKDVYLEFKKGKVVKAKAKKNEKLLKELIKQKNADKVGEFSLTDKRFSHIDKFMATTLYDENFGGKWGNTHLALGNSYHDTYTGDVKKMKDKDWKKLGFNESQEHTDIMATQDRVVEAILKDGRKRVIYKGGEFTL